MSDVAIILICVAIAFGSVLIAEGIKFIAKRISKKKGRQIDMKKLEYPLASMPIVFTFVIAFIVLHFAVKMNLNDNLKLCAIFASSTQTIYTFVVQLTRKGVNGFIVELKKLSAKIKDKKSIHDNAQELIDTMETVAEAENDNKPQPVETVDSWLKILKKGK